MLIKLLSGLLLRASRFVQYAYSSPVMAGDVVYVSDGFGGLAARPGLYALSRLNGAVLWSTMDLNGPVFAAPAVIDGALYVGTWSANATSPAALHKFAL